MCRQPGVNDEKVKVGKIAGKTLRLALQSYYNRFDAARRLGKRCSVFVVVACHGLAAATERLYEHGISQASATPALKR